MQYQTWLDKKLSGISCFFLFKKKLTLNCQVLQYLLIYITVAFILNVLLFNRVNPAFVGCSLILVSLIFFFSPVLLLKEGVKTWTIWPMVFFFSAYLMSYVYSISLIIFVFFFVFSRYSLKISSQSLKSNHLKPYNHYLFPQAFSLSIKNKL